MSAPLRLENVCKTFLMHLMGGIELPVLANFNLRVAPGECVVLGGPSGAGKSSILKMIYGNYRCTAGRILIRHDAGVTDVAAADARDVLRLRRLVVSTVSQFLRVIPRVSALDVVADPLWELGIDRESGRAQAAVMLDRLAIPRHLWPLPPATFSGGEQQRVNIARGFIAPKPILLLDEPTASLDADNRAIVSELIGEKKAAGITILGIFHDADVRDKIADRVIDVTRFAPAAP
jgi:alpha-D-ribose 1-methylphosphonate 5-triphosphate synthase subunit PhnL